MGRAARTDAGAVRLVLFGCLFVLGLLPVLAVPIPAMVDYPNHLARMYLLVRDGTPAESPIYQAVWTLSPNLALDLVVPRLARLMSVETATRMFLLASQVLTVTGAVAIELAVKRRFGISGFVALMVLYSLPFAWGFLNFQFGLGIGLWGIAAWLVLQERLPALRFLLHALVVAALFASHLFALGIYGFTLGLHELWRARSRRAPLGESAVRFGMLALPALVLLGLMLAAGGTVGEAGNRWHLAFKPFWLFASLNGYSLQLSAVCSAALAVLVYALARAGALRLVDSGAWILVGLGLLYLAVPSHLFDTAFVDLRILVAAALILPAFLTVSPPTRRLARNAALLVVAVILANLGLAGWVALAHRDSYAAMIASFGQLEKGARVLIAHSEEGTNPPFADLTAYPMYNAPTLAVHYADAFVPTLFTSAGKQPIAPRGPYRRLAVPYGAPAPVAVLRRLAQGESLPGVPSYVRTWQTDFTYLYVLGPAAPNPMPDLLEFREADPRFAVYRIRKAGG
ncbi:hypothetical protein [Methylobacterium planeticum]|uniref:YfhO family protein n=1 Tax=Methylobacterium planeticum TaxID=2615211 RepID=A0A6N6MUG1_9HYPH|nr:hypothetical protein [Methylobacterium planeticum]KAB1075578.1 hypothetical protein F6X51_02535 [Methylobacterium planeticum]